jgi:hypothetical protein
MDFIKNTFKSKETGPPERIRLTAKNVGQWPNFDKLLKEDKIRFDRTGRLRYKHGAPVGDLVLTRTKKDGTPIYKESATEWFDPESQKAKEFIWP